MDMSLLTATQRYAEAKPATEPKPGQGAGGMGDAFRNLAMDFAQTLAHSEEVAKQSMVGDADPHALVQALAQTELAVETAVTVRNKVVDAYQEILRMPV
ncbi:flagellar hook-basal body complex protein FliE [Pseudosulfitobacter sp. DSM 107133]|uniref:flagellar hook-basal body complex protein FliE n=1 Tax=Pseudosulfitobacter sp. DSM 107133 TaxID=2883100 RepID=UPI000DF3A026|nr:flagellar hook-basal body complex protein FliE [Pseudosulfitobacter sp. DSM 107133]UOA28823.1 Flagellar hook-basal body complex protein FliE [Pseudosulfitobacter sp. DSM 107133]